VNKKNFGYSGETVACTYLKNKNYKILERNFYYHGGELDIIAYDRDHNTLVFVEVKTRANLKFGYGVEAVGYVKLNNIIKGAKYYLYIKGINNVNIRFDVIDLYYINRKFLINHIKQIIWYCKP